jgi:hypothetical protein
VTAAQQTAKSKETSTAQTQEENASTVTLPVKLATVLAATNVKLAIPHCIMRYRQTTAVNAMRDVMGVKDPETTTVCSAEVTSILISRVFLGKLCA